MKGNLTRLLTLEIRREQDLLLCRQRARRLAAAFGFDRQEQTRIATAVSEIVRNALEHAHGGKIEFAVETARPRAGRDGSKEQQSFVVVVRDQGPGITPFAHRTTGDGLGVGLQGAERLVDDLDVLTGSGGTTITLRKSLPSGSPVRSAAEIQATVDRVAAEPPTDPLTEVQLQNQELLRALEEVQGQREDITRVNRELADTNTGVLALYDELETLHRVSVLLASKLDLKTLLQAIIDATTDLTAAQFGAFLYREGNEGPWSLHAIAGPASKVLGDLPVTAHGKLFDGEVMAELHADHADPQRQQVPQQPSKLATAFADQFLLKSCLTIPVSGESRMLGAMVFGSADPGAFTERSERIVSSIAAQAVIGIEKALLFERVQSASTAKDRFLAMLSHELRTPLNPVLAVITNLVGDDRLPLEVQQDIDVVLRNVRLEARLIDDLLDFSRIINGKLQLHREPVDLHALIHNVVSICAEDIAGGAQSVTLSLDAPHATVFGDAARLQQVLWNLLKNAVKFTPTEGRITIQTTSSEPDWVAVTVADSGVGIDPMALSRIFDAFEQGDLDTTAKFGGLGLGLAITKAFVELHGGTIRASSEGGGLGTQLTVRLPLLAESSITLTGRPPATFAPPTKEQRLATLLLVDDHADTLSVMSRLLTRRGYQVLMATSCESALEIARQNRFDLIVSDLGLPDGSGLTLLPQLRAFGEVPAVALSGYGMEEDVRQTLAAGYDEHLTKPIDFSLLTQTISRLLPALTA